MNPLEHQSAVLKRLRRILVDLLAIFHVLVNSFVKVKFEYFAYRQVVAELWASNTLQKEPLARWLARLQILITICRNARLMMLYDWI
jgi:hypothetical protein